jgi:hypothetical protein
MCEDFEKDICPIDKMCTKAHTEEELNYYKDEATRIS